MLRALPAHCPKITVMDVYCKPIAGAKVYARQHYGLMSVENPIGITNSAGELVAPAVYQGSVCTFRAALLGYFGAGAACPPVGGDSWIDSVEVTMDFAVSTSSGKVVDAAGKPVAGAEVTTDFGPSSVTNADGEYTIEHMPTWNVRLDARKGKASGANTDAKGRVVSKPETVIVLR